MKKIILFLIAISTLLASQSSLADYSEQARLIKTDSDEHDTIIEKLDGSRWLLQHNRVCRSMTTEFPVTLIIKDGKIDRLKVSFNEICDVYEALPYTGDAEITELIKSKNLIIPDHQAKLKWNNEIHDIDYSGEGCRQIYQFKEKLVYLSLDYQKDFQQMALPGNQGVCKFRFVNSQSIEKITPTEKLTIEGLDYQAQSNKVYFYWDPVKSIEKPYYVLAYSKFELNTDDYADWKEMPNARLVHDHSYTVDRLANGQRYNFYITVLDENLKPGKWSLLNVAPVAPILPTDDDPIEGEEEHFEVNTIDAGDHFLLKWSSDENARRYFIRLYLDGKQELFKIVKTDTTEWKVPKKEEDLGKGFRFTVRTLPKGPFLPRQKDGVYWRYIK